VSESRRQYQKEYREAYKARTRRVNLTFNADEYQAFSQAVSKLKATTFIKELALAQLAAQLRLPDMITDELATLRFAILNIANNVNQTAHYSHRIRGMVEADENDLLQHLKQLEEVIRTYTEGRIMEAGHDH